MPNSSLGNLQPGFKLFSNAIKRNVVAALEQRQDLHSFDVRYGTGRVRVSLYAGYTGIPYEIAERCVQDVQELKEEYVSNQGKFNVTLSGKVITGQCNDYFFNKDFGCCDIKGESAVKILLPLEVYIAWGEDFSEKELAVMNRERVFPYHNPDDKLNVWEKVKSYFS